MQVLRRYFSWLSEAFVILALLLVINNYLGNQELLIKADGKGYYDYLPATFIYHDLNFHFTDTLKTDFYDQQSYSSGYLKTVNGKQIDKYFPGVSFLWAPFFLGAHYYALNNDVVADGYSWPYQRGIFYAAIFYLWLGLLYLRKLLTGLKINPILILVVQLLLVLATPLIHYIQYDPAFTHVYSFSLITIFTFYLFQFLRENKTKDLLIAGFVLGFIVIIRPVNLMAIGIIILYFKSFEEFSTYLYRFTTDLLKPILFALIPFFMVVSIVPLMWHYQTGQFFVWGYQDEGFNFMDPEFINFLFSFRKGVFVHTPILFVTLIGVMMVWVFQKKHFQLFGLLLLLTAISYVLSSWWAWAYGAGFGSRPMIDYYVIFAIALAYFLNAFKPVSASIIMVLLLFVFVPLNLIQARQFQRYIFDWNLMSYEKFKIIGLHTEPKYTGIFFKKVISYTDENVVLSQQILVQNPINLNPSEIKWFKEITLDTLQDFSTVNYVTIQADIAFTEGNGSVILTITNPNNENNYWYANGIFSSTLKENTRTDAVIYYKVPAIKPNSTISVAIESKGDTMAIYGITVNLISK